MFKGVIHANVRALLPFWIRRMPKRVVNICSGNFTLESMLRLNGFTGRIEGCDVSLYTSSIGAALANKPFALKFTEKADPDLQVFAKYLDTTDGCAAVVAVMLDLSEHQRRKNAFQKRMWRAHMSQADELVTKTMERIAKKRDELKLDDYHARDGVEVLKSLKGESDVLAISSPPTYSGDYEKIYKWFEEIFVWDKPGYTNIGASDEFARIIVENCGQWILFAEDRNPETEKVCGEPLAQANRGAFKNVYLYSNVKESPKLIRRVVATDEFPFQRFTDHDDIKADSVVTFAEVTMNQANYFRQLYSSVHPKQAAGSFCYVFAIDGKAFGLCMLSLPEMNLTYKGKSIGGEYIYMMSDLPVASDRHQRLSKLVVECVKSAELRDALQHRLVMPCNYVFTSAFSEKPVSMKYRGAYELYNRKEPNERGLYTINYLAKMGEKTLAETFAGWFKKSYQDRRVTKADSAS